MDWWLKALPVLDTETTGLDRYGKDSIVQLSLIAVTPDGTKMDGGISTLVKPTTPMSKVAKKIHGISHKRAMEEGVDPREVLLTVSDLLQSAINRGYPLCVHNALFDLPILMTEFQRHGVPAPIGLLVVDTQMIEGSILHGFRGTHLDDMAMRYRVSSTRRKQHDSEEDCILTRRVLWKQTQQYPHLRVHPSTLHAMQEKINAELGAAYQKGRNERWPFGRWTPEQLQQLSCAL